MMKTFLGRDLTLTETEWNLVSILSVVMKPIAPVLDKLQGESLPTINLVLPQLSSLMLGYQEMDGEFGVIAKLIRSLNDYFNPNDLLYRFEAEEYKNCVLGAFLDPRFKSFFLISNREERHSLQRKAKELATRSSRVH